MSALHILLERLGEQLGAAVVARVPRPPPVRVARCTHRQAAYLHRQLRVATAQVGALEAVVAQLKGDLDEQRRRIVIAPGVWIRKRST